MRRVILALAATVVTASAMAAGAAGAKRCAGVAVDGGWSRLALPAFPVRRAYGPAGTPGRPVALAVAAQHPNVVLVASSSAVLRSADGGCTWRLVFEIGGAPEAATPLGPLENITSVTLADTGRGPVRAYLTLAGYDGGVAPTVRILASADGGQTWVTGGGLPVAGTTLANANKGSPRVLATAPGDPATAYVLLCEGVASRCAGQLWATSDGGRGWTRRADVGATSRATGTAFGGFVTVDPRDARRLWVADYDPGPLLESADGGRTVRSSGPSLPGIHEIQARRLPGRPGPVLTAVDWTRTTWRVSTDGGARYAVTTGPAPAANGELTQTADPDDVALLGDDGHSHSAVFARVPASRRGVRRWAELTPPGRPDLHALATDRTGSPALVALGSDALWRRDRPYAAPAAPPATAAGPVPGAVDPRPVLALDRSHVELPAGASGTVGVRAAVPRTRSPVELVLLVDGTGSMAPAIQAIRAQAAAMVAALAAEGVPARYGVGQFGEYALPEYGGTDPQLNVPYQRLRDLGPADETFAGALALLGDAGGSTDTKTSAFPALYQAATGAGQRVGGTVRYATTDIPPEQQFTFAPGALHVLVAVTDSDAHRPPQDPAYPGPPLPTVLGALTGRGVRVLGLDVADGPEPVRGLAWLRQVATGTGAVAPADGADCDGDGHSDVVAGGPLVCTVPVDGGGAAPRAFTAAITGMLRSLPDVQHVRLDVATGRDVATLPPAAARRVMDLRTASLPAMGTTLRLTCPAAPASGDHGIVVRLRIGDRPAVTAPLTLRCQSAATSAARRPGPDLDASASGPDRPGRPGGAVAPAPGGDTAPITHLRPLTVTEAAAVPRRSDQAALAVQAAAVLTAAAAAAAHRTRTRAEGARTR